MERNKDSRITFDMADTSLGRELGKARAGRPLRKMVELCNNEVDIATLSRLERDLIETPSRKTMAAISLGYGIPLQFLAQLAYCGSPVSIDPAVPVPA